MTKNNFNLLWSSPTFIITAFYVGSENTFSKNLFLFHIALLSFALLGWFFLPQEMNNGLIPLVLLLLYRSYRIYKR